MEIVILFSVLEKGCLCNITNINDFLVVKGVNLYNKSIKVTSYNIEDIKTKLENSRTGELKDNIVIRGKLLLLIIN